MVVALTRGKREVRVFIDCLLLKPLGDGVAALLLFGEVLDGNRSRLDLIRLSLLLPSEPAAVPAEFACSPRCQFAELLVVDRRQVHIRL